MAKPIALCVGQFSDMSLEDICKMASEIGYDGLEMSFRSSIINLPRAASDKAYCDELNACLLYTSPSPRARTRSRMPSSA